MSDQTNEHIHEAETSTQNILPSEQTENESVASKEKNPLYWIFDYLEILVFSVCAVLVLFSFGFRLCKVSGDSMRNTLRDGEMLLTVNYLKPETGDIIVFHQTGDVYNEPLVKRVIATEGQTVRIDYEAQTVSVDGQRLNESYASLLGARNPFTGEYTVVDKMWVYGNISIDDMVFEATVPDGCYFVMGDNRNHSADSRTSAIGFVDERRILGTVVCRLSPFNTADELN